MLLLIKAKRKAAKADAKTTESKEACSHSGEKKAGCCSALVHRLLLMRLNQPQAKKAGCCAGGEKKLLAAMIKRVACN
jgi:hypothetical protein